MAFPPSFVRSMEALLGRDAASLLAALDTPPAVSIRFNPLKMPAVAPLSSPAPADAVPWSADGRYLSGRPAFTFDPLFHAGAYYVQEASSMFAGLMARHIADGPVRMLDLCAAPGGKSTLYRAVLPAGSLLVANEPLPARVRVLSENMQKWGHPDVVVTNDYPAAFASLPGFFDVVAVDAPCSGEGMFRKDARAVEEWSEANVEMCCQRQRDIVRDVWPALRPGGYLIYSTCTFNTRENEENVRWIADSLGADVVELPADSAWAITGSLLPAEAALPVYRFLPHRTRGEGFFAALLRKHEGVSGCGAARDARVRKGGSRPAVVPAVCKSWLTAPRDYTWELTDGAVSAIHTAHAADVAALRRALRVVSAGVPVAEEKGRVWAPLPALALSAPFAADVFPRAELHYADALSYLRGQTLVLPADTSRGMVCVTYRGLPLGFVKNVGNRANNLYPDAWRIRSGHLPDEPPCVC